MIGSTNIFARRLLGWYTAARRDLPWRVAMDAPRDTLPDPYLVLVSEAMLQQTQVATVIPFFRRFITQFPSVRALADADEQRVLRAWQGLGYYSRARHLLAAARAIVLDHGGGVPSDLATLLTLPGVGRYTAGAIASLAFGVRAPILDGNVARVLCRIDRVESDPREKATQTLLWSRAETILPRRRPGDFNSALMELGATICTPRSPQCLICPVRSQCEAFATGVQDCIPPPRKTKPTPLVQRWTYCIRRRTDGRYLIQQRPSRGRWAGMWQFITVKANESALLPVRTTTARKLGVVAHGLTHRRYKFEVLTCEAMARSSVQLSGAAYKWVRLDELERHPLPKPHLTVARMLSATPADS